MKKSPKIADQFYCEYCDYTCSKRCDYDKHTLTLKHKNRTKLNNLEQKVAENETKFICKSCNKGYKARNSLWYHEQKCSHKVQNINNDNEPSDKDLIMLLIKENSELKTMMMEVIKNGTNNNNTTHTNSHNKAFNLNFFLNETCKNAMNIMDFVDSIQLQLSDLEKIGEIGYVEGISNIIVKNLKKLDVTERPVHCTDSKRETLYIKDENKWEKENEDKHKMKRAIKRLANKNISMLSEFKKLYPDCIYSESKKSDQYNKIIIEAFELNDLEKQEKVIKKITKEVTIDKENNS